MPLPDDEAQAPEAADSEKTPTTRIFSGPPDVSIPTPPPGFTLSKLRRMLTYRLTHLGLAAMPEVAKDLEDPALAAAFGAQAKHLLAIAAQIRAALAWRAMRNASEAWTDYVRANDIAAWQRVMSMIGEIWTRYEAVVAWDPSLRHKLSGLALFDSAQRAPSRAAASARKRNRKAKAAEPAREAAPAPTGAKVVITT